MLELSSYHHDDVFQGLLLRYTARDNETKREQEMETWFKLQSRFKVLDEKNGNFIQV